MKRNVQGWILFAFALPGVLVGYLWLLLLCVVYVAEWKSLRFQGAGVLTARTRQWAAEYWGFSTTLGRAVLYHPNSYDDTPLILDRRVERHEFVHIKQWEDELVQAFLVGLVSALVTGNWWLFVGIWCSGVAWKLPNFVTAVLRYGWRGLYRDTEHERSAYGQTDILGLVPGSDTKSWDELRDEQRERQKTVL